MVSARERGTKRAPRRQDTPLEVDLTVSFRFGERPEDRVTVMDNRRVPMVNSVFESRDLVMRNFVRLLLKAAVTQPRVAAELFPVLRLMRRSR